MSKTKKSSFPPTMMFAFMKMIAPVQRHPLPPKPLEPSQLPKNPYSRELNPDAHDAYNHCLQSQLEAGDNPTLLMYARCLGFLIIEAPDDAARHYISLEITECGGDAVRMNELALLYIDGLFRLFRKVKDHTPQPSSNSSQVSFEENEEFSFSSTVNPNPTDHNDSKLAALERDNFCCMVTGGVEKDYYKSLTQHDRNTRYPNPSTTRTHFCHILPKPSLQTFRLPDAHWAGTVWAIVLNYGHITVDELDGVHFYRLCNGLTLTTRIHEEFDQLCLWFEAIPGTTPHVYSVCTQYPHCDAVASLPHPRIVAFSTTTSHPLPDPRFLKLHAVVCRVGHLSGVTEYLDMWDDEH